MINFISGNKVNLMSKDITNGELSICINNYLSGWC
jgi:hypothetical protein